MREYGVQAVTQGQNLQFYRGAEYAGYHKCQEGVQGALCKHKVGLSNIPREKVRGCRWRNEF